MTLINGIDNKIRTLFISPYFKFGMFGRDKVLVQSIERINERLERG